MQLHLQPQNVFSYLLDARRILRAGGVFMLHQVDLATPGGMHHFMAQYLHGTWKHELGDLRRRGHVFFMSEDQLRALAGRRRLRGRPPRRRLPGAGPRAVARHRGPRPARVPRPFARATGCATCAVDEVRLVRIAGEDTVHAIWHERRAPIGSAHYFVDAGFEWDRVAPIERDELERYGELEPLEAWEWPRRPPG